MSDRTNDPVPGIVPLSTTNGGLATELHEGFVPPAIIEQFAHPPAPPVADTPEKIDPKTGLRIYQEGSKVGPGDPRKGVWGFDIDAPVAPVETPSTPPDQLRVECVVRADGSQAWSASGAILPAEVSGTARKVALHVASALIARAMGW